MKNSEFFKKWGPFYKGMDAKAILLSFANHLEYSLSKDQYTATERDMYHALALAARDRLNERWIRTQQLYYARDVKRVYYLSAEYLMGRALINNLRNLGIYPEAKKAMDELNLDLEELANNEPDMGLGNGGLGRLAACFLDSMATLELPAYGYGIRYEFGIFDQVIRDLRQVEQPENWLKYGNAWEIPRPERTTTVLFYGRAEEVKTDGRFKYEWKDAQQVIGVPYDIPIPGYGNNTVNTLRLWSARATNEFDLQYFQDGDYLKAVREKNLSETISKVLYPNDQNLKGRELRLKQQYFFVSCSIQDIIRRYLRTHDDDFEQFPDKVAIQMNDTHPSLAIPELMRIFLDDYQMRWERAWDLTVRTCAYTNHTLLAEALEKWSLPMFGKLLPRHLLIIYEINRRFLRQVSVHCLNNNDCLRNMSLIEEGGEKKVRMAHLAIVGSHSVNGVAELHSRLLRERALKDFYEIFPERFNNKTNGVTPRRWLLCANPDLADLITEHIGRDWLTDLSRLQELESLTENQSFRERWLGIKRQNKEKFIYQVCDITDQLVDPRTIFDFQVKRIHEYKRQLLNILHVIYCWLKLRRDSDFDMHPRTFFFGGKAAPSYFIAKLTIRLICHVAEMINGDKRTRDFLRVLFLPNYRVSLAERIFPAADISQQISTAGYEASGTSNMKFALNGALTVGTPDGANIEIKEEVGEENIFIFGLTESEIAKMTLEYDPREYYQADPILKEAVDLIQNGFFCPEEPALFQPLTDSLLNRDPYFVLADFAAYHQCLEKTDALYNDPHAWTRKAILNVARMGKFSSDRTVYQYNQEIWKAAPLTITPPEPPENSELNVNC